MKKLAIPVFTVLSFYSCSGNKNQTGDSKWPSLTDTIIHPSLKDPKVMDTMFVKSAIDTTLPETVDTILMPGPNPPYTPVVSIRKVGVRKKGRKFILNSPNY